MGRTSRATWAKRIERWEASGLTAKEFATELDVSPKSLSFWKWKLRRECSESPAVHTADAVAPLPSAGAATRQPRFLELVPSLPKSAPQLEVVLSTGIRVRVPSGFDERTLKRVVALLGGA